MGRKTSGSKDKLKSKSERERDQGHDPHTLIMATPAKPRMHLTNPSGAQFWHPTPIQEESLSTSSTSLSSMSLTSRLLSLDRERGPRPAFVAETPVGVRMVSDWQYAEDEEEGDEGLGELMVMTDDEDGDEEEGGGGKRVCSRDTCKIGDWRFCCIMVKHCRDVAETYLS